MGWWSYYLKCLSARGGPSHQFICCGIGALSGSHLLNKPRSWLTDTSWSARGSECCTVLLWCTSSGRHLLLLWCAHSRWWFAWSVCGCCRSSLWCCLCNRCCWWLCWWCLQQRLWCSWSYICCGGCARFDSIWVTFMDVITCTSVLSSTYNLYKVWTMVSFTNDLSREPEALVIVEDRYSLPCIQQGLGSTVTVIVFSTLGGTFVESVTVIWSTGVLVVDPLWECCVDVSLMEHLSQWS